MYQNKDKHCNAIYNSRITKFVKIQNRNLITRKNDILKWIEENKELTTSHPEAKRQENQNELNSKNKELNKINKLLETELIAAQQTLIDERWKDRTRELAQAMKTIADSFGSAVTKYFTDYFSNQNPSERDFRADLGKGFSSAGGKMIGNFAQQQVFGNQGFLGSLTGSLLGREWQDALFPKTQLQLAQDRTDFLRHIVEKGIKIE